MGNEAYISRETGAVYYASDTDSPDDEVPDDLDDLDRYVAVPHKNDLSLGRKLALRFAAQEVPERYERVEGFFRAKGAYARFKDLLESEGLLDQWYNFEAVATERALREWCAENDIEVLRTGSESA